MMFPYEVPVDPGTVGIDRRRLQKVVDRFKRQHENGLFPGGQVSLRRHGKPVLNMACGIARGIRPEEGIDPVEVTSRTPFSVLSAGKPMAAVAVAMLEERGLLDPNAPVAELIPGFEAHGKGEITLLDVLTHRAGILLPDLVRDRYLWEDREGVLDSLIEAVPVYRRGIFAYMPYEYGWILAEIIARVDGRTIAEFFATELAEPLGLPGLTFGYGGRDPETLAFSYWLGKEKVMVGGTNVAAGFEERNNSPEQFNSMNPAVSLVADAASLASFYEFVLAGGVTREGKRLLSETTLQKYTACSFKGWERTSKAFCSVGRGFMLGGSLPAVYGYWNTGSCFGHPGGFSTLAFGDRDTGLAAAIVTNGNRSFADVARRFMPLAHGLRKACRHVN